MFPTYSSNRISSFLIFVKVSDLAVHGQEFLAEDLALCVVDRAHDVDDVFLGRAKALASIVHLLRGSLDVPLGLLANGSL